MVSMKNKIILLSDAEIDQLYALPNFTDEDRELFFTLSKIEYEYLSKYRTLKNQIYFILQLGYFRATQKFYNFNLQDVGNDVSFLNAKYFESHDNNNQLNSLINRPYRETITSQRDAILKLCNYINWSSDFTSKIATHLSELIRYHPKVEIAFCELMKYFEAERIVIPSYRTLQDIFTKVLSIHEESLDKILLSIPEEIKSQLIAIIGNHDKGQDDKNKNDQKDDGDDNNSGDGASIGKNDIIIELNTIRYDQKDFKYTASHLEIKKVHKIAPLYEFSKSFLPLLNISKNSISHYADLVGTYSASRLRQLKSTRQFLYVLCFIHHRYKEFTDNLITTFQYHVNLILEKGTEYAGEEFQKHCSSLVLDFPNLAKFLKWFPSEDINQDLTYAEFSKEAYKILPKAQFEPMAKFLEGKTFDKTKAQWEFYAKSSPLLSRYLRPVILNVAFELVDYKSNLLELIGILRTHYIKKKNPGSLKIASNSDIIKDKSMIPYLKSSTDPEYFDPYRLEFYVYLKMQANIDKGRLCCNDSIFFSKLDSDLVPEEVVDKVEEIATKFGYHKIPIYCDKRLVQALDNLDQALMETNSNISSGDNKNIKTITDEAGNTSWNLLYEAKEPLEDAFFSNLPKIEIADLLTFIGEKVNLWDAFTHIKHKYIKRKKPEVLALNACILSEAFGISVNSMNEMCDLNINLLRSTKQDFIRVETLENANDLLSNYIYKLPIFKAWDLLDGKTLADSDGKKHPTSDSTIQSRYSSKYIGKGRGISIYSLVANHVVVNSKTIGLNSYEGHGLYDLIYGNNSDITIDYATGDNHSLNPVNFVVLDSIDVGYLPSIKNIEGAAENIYSPKATTNYTGLIQPKDQIKKSLITSNKKGITRVLLSLLLQEGTQTTIIRKLSSHDRYAKLRAGLYEYNKIFKSTHVLNMINDIKLRKAIKAARNRTEAYHQLQGMIRKVYHGVFKGKRIIDNSISSHAVRLLANCIIAYNATVLNILYEKLINSGAPQEIIDKFIRISPIAWDHLSFTGRYNFKKDGSTVDLEMMLKTLEERLYKNLKT